MRLLTPRIARLTTAATIAFGLTAIMTSASASTGAGGSLEIGDTARLVAKGAAISVPVTLLCDSTGNNVVMLSVKEARGRELVEGSGAAEVGCGQTADVLVSSEGGVFRAGTALAVAQVLVCDPVLGCSGLTDTAEIAIHNR